MGIKVVKSVIFSWHYSSTSKSIIYSRWKHSRSNVGRFLWRILGWWNDVKLMDDIESDFRRGRQGYYRW